jgi:branched-chain amino acid transport system substrate-binding protein
MGGDGMHPDEFAAIGGPESKGTLMTFRPEPAQTRPSQGVAKFRKPRTSIRRPIRSTATRHAGDRAGRRSIKSLDAKKVAAEVTQPASLSDVIGELKYDKKGDITRPDYVFTRGRRSRQDHLRRE